MASKVLCLTSLAIMKCAEMQFRFSVIVVTKKKSVREN